MADADEVLRSLGEKLKRRRMRATDLFKTMDTGGNGAISGQDLRAGLADVGFKVTDQEFAAIMSKMDRDGGGDVSVKDFEKCLRYAERMPLKKKDKRKQGMTAEDKEEFRQIFCLFKQLCRAREQEDMDPDLVEWDESGGISVDELEQLLETVGLKLKKMELESIAREIDTDGNGEIDFQEFCDCMTKKIQVDYSPDEIAKSFKAFARNAPEGMIRVQDLRNALTTYMHKELIDAEVDELLLHYKDNFVRIPGQEVEYFDYQDYIDLMTPINERSAGD
mmetsp:Transcript_67319/g.156286  ORF Transcript_67319/g.156286 Transcript_67319/m.156286 type:complete len:278 (+) Transcript_67319:292-1125(+)|eukprot:CAMPEP_0171074818 /NCGR_PEP_ID=MMETSP0766_2-20121228/12386_1 /TAXON_ID=439317 /ORGANISM="Gambierdiscus australes, Strain CAWD 149" /LENGTH=277 /DNA_ID=CAMNT_0011531637 /DNA_START=116 /DNA_END=949 /DNA_ORIENTATION=+